MRNSDKNTKRFRRKLRPLHVLVILIFIEICFIACELAVADIARRIPNLPGDELSATLGQVDKTQVTDFKYIDDENVPYQFGLKSPPAYDTKTGRLELWLENPKTNQTMIKAQALSADGTALGETGLIAPGQYVRDIKLSGEPAVLKIMGYEPETYYSAGSFELALN